MITAGSTIPTHTQNPDRGGQGPAAGERDRLAPFESLIDETEAVRECFANPDGVTHVDGGDRAQVDREVLTAVTDEQLAIAVPESDGGAAVVLSYAEIASISREDERLCLRTVDGVGLEWSCDVSGGPSASLCRHLSWIGAIRQRVQQCRTDVDLAVDELTQYADRLAWEDGHDLYCDLREQLDSLISDVYATEPVSPDVLAPELTDIGRTLEHARARFAIERAESQLELGQQLVENGDYDQGHKVLRQARTCFRRAEQRREFLRRGDAFQFGTQRELAEELDRLEWRLELAASEPIRQAYEAKVTAQAASDREQSVAEWETAFRRFGHILTLEWGSNTCGFAGDKETVRTETGCAAAALIEGHLELGNERWDDATETPETAFKTSLRCCLAAQEHMARARELAVTFAPDRVGEIDSRLETITDVIDRMRTHGPSQTTRQESDAEDPTDREKQESGAADPTDTASESADVVRAQTDPTGEEQGDTARAESEPTADSASGRKAAPDSDRTRHPSLSDLADIDTHHDISPDVPELRIKTSESERSDDEKDTETPADGSSSSERPQPEGKLQ